MAWRSGVKMATQTDGLRPTNEGLTLEERAGAAARAKFADWHKAELEGRPRRILYFGIALGLIAAIALAFWVPGLR
jgi:hypothetical protein